MRRITVAQKQVVCVGGTPASWSPQTRVYEGGTVMRGFPPVVIILSLALGLVMFGGGALPEAHASPNFSLVDRFSLGNPSGMPNGNPFFFGSTPTYLNRLLEVLGGSVFRRHLYEPEEAAVWGPGGEFGGELYALSVVTGLPKDSLLHEFQRVLFQFADIADTTAACGGTMEGDWCVFSTVDRYYPMQAYMHNTGCGARTYRRLHFGEATGLGYPGTGCSEVGSAANDPTRTFASFRSLAGDFSTCTFPTDCGPNNPPDLSAMCGFRMRYEVAYEEITGNWVLTDPSVDPNGGFTQGTGYVDGGVTVNSLGSRSAESRVVCLPEY